ncbi:MAG: sortase [Anaerolineae bacterium]|nr:sortase [Anaerolineae bacterium]
MFDRSKAQPYSLLANALVLVGVLLMLAGAVLTGPGLEPLVVSHVYPETAPSGPALTQPAPPTPMPTPTPATVSVSILPVFDGTLEEGDAHEVPVQPSPTPTPAPEAPPPVGLPPTRVVIPSIDLDAPVVLSPFNVTEVDGTQQGTWTVPAERAAGWHAGTAALGLPGNTVLNGHNTTRGEVFRDLHLLEPGARVILYSGQKAFIYEVDQILILPEAGQPMEVRIANARYIQPTRDERITFITCHPYNSLQYRLVVIARPLMVEEVFE